VDQVGADVHLTHADGMDPKHVTIGNGLLELGIKIAEPLAETGLPIAAPPHPYEIVRRGQHENDRK
jgi:hypothetical protein